MTALLAKVISFPAQLEEFAEALFHMSETYYGM